MIYYTGIGSRNIPNDIISKFESYGALLASKGFVLRSGAARGADQAFEDGCDSVDGSKEIYLPWKKFNDSRSPLYDLSPEAEQKAADVYGSRWEYLNTTTKQFMTRNIYQITGSKLDTLSSFVVCWTPDGCATAKCRRKETGGTGQAISYADELDIPIFNLMNELAERCMCNFITYLTEQTGHE